MLAHHPGIPKFPQRQTSKPVSSDGNPLPSLNNANSLNDSEPKTKGSRAGKPKSRSGCGTCKIRRVKCDEGRPQCKRCIKFGTVCDGYMTPGPQSLPSRRTLLPKGASNVLPPLSLAQSHLPGNVQIGPRFNSEYENHFFGLYVREIAAQIAGPFKSSLWERLIPQASEAEPFICQIVIGLGAMSEVSKVDSRADLFVPNKRIMYEYALKQYEKALQGMRRAIATGKHNIRNALIACILVFCFESLQGDAKSATQNAQSGLALLGEWMAQHDGPNGDPSCLAFVKNKTGFYEVESELLQAFSALDTQVLFFLDTRSDTQHLNFIEEFRPAIKYHMPHRFESLSESRDFWLLIQRRNYHFNIIAIEAMNKRGVKAPPDTHKDINPRKLDQWGVDNLSKSAPPLEAVDLRAEMKSHREDIRRWERASTDVFVRVQREGTQEEIVALALLKIYANLNHIQLEAAFMGSETEYDDFLPEFTTIVEFSEEVYPYLASSPSQSNSKAPRRSNIGGLFRFDLGIVYPLSSVGFRCRDTTIRSRAISLLNASSYREGIYDSRTIGCLTGWIRKIEEEGIDSKGYIPEECRAAMTLCDVDVKNRSVLLECMLKGKGGMVRRRSERLEWSFGIGEELDLRLGTGDRRVH